MLYVSEIGTKEVRLIFPLKMLALFCEARWENGNGGASIQTTL